MKEQIIYCGFATVYIINHYFNTKMNINNHILIVLLCFFLVVTKIHAHNDGTNHSAHDHGAPDLDGDCDVGGLVIMIILFALLFLVSCCLNIYQFRLRHGNVITAEVEYNAFS